MDNIIFWDMTPCTVAEFYRGFNEHITSVFMVNEYAKQLVAMYVHFYRLQDVTTQTPLWEPEILQACALM